MLTVFIHTYNPVYIKNNCENVIKLTILKKKYASNKIDFVLFCSR